MQTDASKQIAPSASRDARGALLAGGVSAILASTCCLGPLVLLTLGFSGAWIANLTVLESYRPVFIGVSLIALFFAGRRIWRPAAACPPGEACAVQQIKRSYKLLFGVVLALVLIALAFPYIAHWFY